MATDREDADPPINIPAPISAPGKRIFAIAGVVVVISAITFWWFHAPKPAEATSSNSILATAPPSPPQPLNADGAPKSD